FLEDHNTTYDAFISKTVGNRGIFKIFFTMMKKLFR
ncbi:MAG: histidine kinase, partial [Sulfurimonas sp.]